MGYSYKITSLWKISSLLIVMFLSHSAKTQQLPDSLLAVNEPMMLLPDSNEVTLSVVASANTIPFGGWWPVLSASGGEGVQWATTYTVTCYPIVECVGCLTVTVDTLLLIPHADSFIGAKAKTVFAQKIPDAAQASAFAGNVHHLTPKKEEQ